MTQCQALIGAFVFPPRDKQVGDSEPSFDYPPLNESYDGGEKDYKS